MRSLSVASRRAESIANCWNTIRDQVTGFMRLNTTSIRIANRARSNALQIYSNPRIICEFLTPEPWVRGGLGWGKKFTTPARIAIVISTCGKDFKFISFVGAAAIAQVFKTHSYHIRSIPSASLRPKSGRGGAGKPANICQ